MTGINDTKKGMTSELDPGVRKVCIITGAAGSIGRATAAVFSQQDWMTIGIDWRPCGSVVDVPIRADLSSFSDLTDVIEVVAALPRIDALVNVAAEQPVGGLDSASVEVWERTLRANVVAPAELCRAATSQLKQSAGAIVSITSVHSAATSKGLLVYSTTKAALAGLMRAVAIDLARFGVTANSVAPGAVDTPMLHDGLARAPDREMALRELTSNIPVKRLGSSSEVANLVYQLTTPGMRYVTGQEVIIDGGVSALLSSESGVE